MMFVASPGVSVAPLIIGMVLCAFLFAAVFAAVLIILIILGRKKGGNK